MIFLLIFVIFAEAAIQIPLHENYESLSDSSIPFTSFQFRGLSSSTAVTNLQNSQYYMTVGIGTPPKIFSVGLSLETSWILVDQKECLQCRRWTYKFYSLQSATFKKTNKKWNTDSAYQMRGNAGKDTVIIGSFNSTSQAVFLIDSEHGMDNLKADGIFGLGFSKGQAVSILKRWYDENYIENMIFSLYLNDISGISGLQDKGQSMLIIDGHDIYKYAAEEEFTYISVLNSDEYWELSLDKVSLGDLTFNSGNKARISSGEKGILGPKEAIDGILQLLQSSANCNTDSNNQLTCNCNANYPDLLIQLSGNAFRIKQAGYLHKLNKDCSLVFGYSEIDDIWILVMLFWEGFIPFMIWKTRKSALLL
ncbi:CYM_7 [Blepharisma stoltei]|uniref:Peptidase A1 domain-containing protein n=1 Tax=Blepharisma stoltei TaxID=1481888 RepID=A0AAU9J5W9_9CILI|nr:unnamed protein product [Blepharisma stoltei]